MAWSKEAIEAARAAIDKIDHRQAKSLDDLTLMVTKAALDAASSIDGDYNAGVEAAAAWHLERAAHYQRQVHDPLGKEAFHTEAAESLLKIKRTP